MKKLICILMAVMIVLSLSACGKGEQSEGNTENQETQQTQQTTKADENVINFEEPIVLFDDDVAKVEVIGFTQKFVNWADSSEYEDAVEKYINFKFTNKSDIQLLVELDNVYFGEDSLILIHSGGTNEVLPGKNARKEYNIKKYSGVSKVALDSMEELYNLEGGFKIYKDIDNSLEEYKSFEFSLADAKESEKPEAEQSNPSLSVYNNFSIDAICVDKSYKNKDSDVLKMVYVFYTVNAGEKNLKLDTFNIDLIVNGTNKYDADQYKYDAIACNYLPEYYHSCYLEEIYVGTSLKLVATFVVPEGDLAAGRTITLDDDRIEGLDTVKFTTDEIKYYESAEDIAKAIDNESYEAEVYAREAADDETTETVKYLLDGEAWDFYVNSTSYNIEFDADNNFYLTVLSMVNSGKYSVRNGYLFCTYDTNDIVLEIPYTIENGEIDIDPVDAFDVKN